MPTISGCICSIKHIPVDLHIPKPHKEIVLRPEILDRYIGRYQFSPTDIMTVTREGNHLVGQLLDGQRFEMFAESEHDFFMKIADAHETFEFSGPGPAKVAIWHQGGTGSKGSAHRVKAEGWKYEGRK